MIDELHSHFVINDYKWQIGGELETPSPEDIQKVIDRAVELLQTEPEGSQLEVGHLIFKKREGVVDVFAHFGETNEN